MRSFLIMSLLWIVLYSQISAQLISLPPFPEGANTQHFTINKRLSEYMHSVWTAEHGLPQNTGIALCQTLDGYLWIGTQEGLARYDGIQFSVFDKTNTPAFKSNYFTALVEDRDGVLWIGTNGGGLVRLRNGVFTTFTTQNGLSNDIVRSLLQDRNGAIWIGTNGGGVCRFKDGVFTAYTTKNGLSNDVVYALIQDHEGAIWMGTLGGGVSRLKDGKFSTYSTQNGLSNDIVRSLMEDRDGAVWIGTNGGGVCKIKDGKWTTYTTKDGLANDRVYALLQDRIGAIWIGTLGGGINRLKDGIFETYNTQNGLSNNGIRSLMEDRDGALWIGTNGGGVDRFKDAMFTTYSTINGLSNDRAVSVLEDSAGNIWIGTSDGLNHFQNGIFKTYTQKEGLPGSAALSLLQDYDGALWVGTDKGLVRIQGERITTYTTTDGLAHNAVQSILQDRNDGALWIGTNGGGLNQFKDNKWKTYTTKDGLSHAAVFALMQARDGALWIGTGGGGLNRFKDGQWTTYSTKTGLSHNVIYSLYEDRDGAIWIGTSGGGINRLKDGKIKAITTSEGLFNDVAYCILEDNAGFLWASCNKGIFRVRMSELNNVADGKLARVSCESFGSGDGMVGSECNGGSQPAGWKSHDGRLWFPTVKGVVVVDPGKIVINSRAPSVLLESIPVNGVDMLKNDSFRPILDSGGSIDLPANTDKIEFHYTAPWFTAPDHVKFKYMLEGYDKAWTEAGMRHTAYYTNLPRGHHYRFRVIACNNDGVWNESGASAMFYLMPHFWETWWFYSLCFVFVVSSGFGAYRTRVRNLQRHAEILERTVAERTEDLQNANEEIQRQMLIQTDQAREIELANTALQQSHEESETLLLNILPAQIAHRLKVGERAIAEKFDSVTVLFADIVGFTNLSATVPPETLVQALNAVFARFDTIVKKHRLEKIKTIGDAYMVAGGLPERSDDHVERVARFALEIQAVMKEVPLRTQKGEFVQLRIGIHTGEAVAGVIGTSKFAYDLWGDTVNTASRMESHGEAGKIHVTEEVYAALKDKFTFEKRGEIEVKGKGVMRTWFLTGLRV